MDILRFEGIYKHGSFILECTKGKPRQNITEVLGVSHNYTIDLI